MRSISPEISSVTGLRSGIAAFMLGGSFSHGRSALGDAIRRVILRGFGCPEEVQVGWGVSEVQAAFVTSLAGTLLSGSALVTSIGRNDGAKR
jgi:hypothetical protein